MEERKQKGEKLQQKTKNLNKKSRKRKGKRAVV